MDEAGKSLKDVMADRTDKLVADGSDDDQIADDRIRACGRYPELKIQIGWLHFHNEKFRQVSARKGGGTRTYQYSRYVEQTVEMLTEYVKNVFLPSGTNEWGQLDVHLSTYNGDVIEQFVDHDGKMLPARYLKGAGIYSSQLYVYLKTKLPERNDNDESHNILESVQQKGEVNRNADDEPRENDKSHIEYADNIVKSDVSHNVSECVVKFKVNNQFPGEIHVQYSKEQNVSTRKASPVLTVTQ